VPPACGQVCLAPRAQSQQLHAPLGEFREANTSTANTHRCEGRLVIVRTMPSGTISMQRKQSEQFYSIARIVVNIHLFHSTLQQAS
jgi:hypothetical protein